MADLVLHHLEKSRSHRILWLFEELGLDYDIVTYARHPKTMRAGPELRVLHPLGKAPIVELQGQYLAESGAIIETVLDLRGEGRLRPAAGTAEHRWFRYWLHYAEGSLMTPLLVALILGQMSGPKVPFFVRPIARALTGAANQAYTNPELERHFDFLEQHLASHTWFAGEQFTAADIQMSYPVDEGRGRAGVTAVSHPHLFAWLDTLKRREAWGRAVEKGGSPSFTA